MRKMNYLIGALALGLGVIVGTLGMSLLTNSSSPTSFISKLRGQDKIQTVSGAVSDSTRTPPTLNTPSDALAQNSTSSDSGNSDLESNQAEQPSNALSLGENKGSAQSSALKQQIITDYKQDIGIFFGAWKSADIDSFRLKLAKAYTGELFEKHAQRAKEYLDQGLGLDVSQITFDRVEVESADTNTATLRVDYRYSARDYSLTDAAPIGDEHEQIVHVRVNLIKQNSRWVITGESNVQ